MTKAKGRTLKDFQRQQAYVQKHPLIGVRVSKEQMDFLKREAKERRWSVANLVSWVLENHFEDFPSADLNRR